MMPVSTDFDLAVWTRPGGSFTITYPLSLLHEIDFLVNEGYRSIPYGGIEVGGLLFGHLDPTSARFEAFRVIPCEHASGPSFVLSEHDISALAQQLETSSSDPDLQGLEAIGWFISHTRKGLQLNDHESVLFDRFFHKPGMITLLVKPEKFKPTRFSFLVRGVAGEVERDGTEHAIILPLSARPGQAPEAPVASIPAPRQTPTQLAPASEQAREQPNDEIAIPATEVQSSASDTPLIETPPETKPQPLPEAKAEKPPEPQPQTPPEPKPEKPAEPVTSLMPLPRKDASPPGGFPGLSPEALQLSHSFETRLAHDHITRRMREQSARSNARLITVLFLAAALGCAVGYWGYLQLPSPNIPLRVRSQATGLIVSWPPEQTRDAVYAAIRIDDSEPRQLPPEDKLAGQTQISATGNNVKIELIAQHWMQDSRGIVRYVRASPPPEPESKPSRPDFSRRGRRR